MNGERDYGWRGRLGVGTPQANPTVEAEMRRLVPRDIEYFTIRLTSASDDPAARLCEYLRRLPDYFDDYGGLRLDAFMFACTSSSYLLPAGEVEAWRDLAEQKLGAPVVLAAAAIEHWLNERGAERIGLLSPYPEWLHAEALAYWRGRGFEPVASTRVDIGSDDTTAIYRQAAASAASALAGLGNADLDAVVIAGTGMPSLPVLRSRSPDAAPIVSSNVALATRALAVLGHGITAPEDWWSRTYIPEHI